MNSIMRSLFPTTNVQLFPLRVTSDSDGHRDSATLVAYSKVRTVSGACTLGEEGVGWSDGQ
jgi:hypothetical protein